MKEKSSSSTAYHCSFCGRSEEEVEKLISGPEVFICDKCVQLCISIVEKKEATPLQIRILKPREIKERLDEYVIGQENVKKTIAVAVYNHYRRILEEEKAVSSAEEEKVEFSKSNVLLLGPTGSGKTLIAKTLAKILEVPFTIADATTLTEAGYVGEDVENIVLRLVQAADYDIKKAEKGIIYIDEIDKIGRTTSNVSITRDVSGEGVQQALLKIIEGTIANIPPKGGRKHPHQEYIKVNTQNILFITGGAFSDLDQVVANRLGKTTMGFISSTEKSSIHHTHEMSDIEKKNHFLSRAESEDLIHFGMIPEFIGRFNCIVNCGQLEEKDLMAILTQPKNALIKEYTSIFRREGVKLTISDSAIAAIAKKAIKTDTGARALRTILEKALRDIMYTIPSEEDIEEIVVDEQHIIKNLPPVVRCREQKKIA